MKKVKFWKVYLSLLLGLSIAEVITPVLTKKSINWTYFFIYEIAIAIILFIALYLTTREK